MARSCRLRRRITLEPSTFSQTQTDSGSSENASTSPVECVVMINCVRVDAWRSRSARVGITSGGKGGIGVFLYKARVGGGAGSVFLRAGEGGRRGMEETAKESAPADPPPTAIEAPDPGLPPD